ncbi:Rossmann-like domain-containing protein [Aromatoleum evansii]|uniref:Rossmann-like domain-containing protein n=1 Tax=Aromatoleum evansii TaxID=59406 RepID=UPI00145E3AB9|nr:DUF364 domain-containing protein [Aromatoleum evansii]NMG28166.1 hypothetical protein [Aromatoleum evansii]
MNFAETYLAQLERIAARGPLPRVRALHLPPASVDPLPGDRGEFCALELEDGSLGLSYVLLDDTLARMRAGEDGFALAGADALELARAYAGGSGILRTLGFAAANAVTRCFFDRAGYRPDTSADSIGGLDLQPGERIGMIGLFTPLLGRILKCGAQLTVVELKAELAGDRDGYRVTLDPAELAGCRKVLSTSTLLLNDTLDHMLGFCGDARWFAMIGPSAGCLPDALFARGVTLVGGSWVHDREGFVDALRSGGERGAYARKFAIAADVYPGFEALLARI